MTPEFFLSHFNRISDAPDAIPRFCSFVLDLAVRGQLVPQQAGEQCAEDLVTSIKTERERRIGNGQLKPTSPLKTIGNEERFDYFVPAGWTFCFVDDFAMKVTDGEHATPIRCQTGRYLLSARNVLNSGIDVTDVDFVPQEEYVRIRKRCDPDKGDILISCSGSVGRVAVVDRDETYTMVRSAALIKLDTSRINPRYVAFALRATPAQEQIALYSKSTAQANLFIGAIRKLRVALPPLEEQHRIVAKVDELMVLCNSIEATRLERENQRARLTAVSLHLLNKGTNSTAFRERAHFYLNHLPRLTALPNQIPALRQAILSLAVQGKLVPQCPDQQTATTRPRLRCREDNLTDESWPNELPCSWKWHRLETISEQITDGEHATPPRIQEQQVPLVTAKNVRDGSMDYGNTDWVSYETAAKAWKRCRPAVGDVLLVCVGATTGRLCVLREAKDMVLVRSVALIRPTSAVESDYLALVLRSPLSQAQIWEKVKVTAQPCLYINRIKSLSIPLPPPAEQHRVISKVSELMSICDRLEEQLVAARSENSRLLEAVLYHALNDARQCA